MQSSDLPSIRRANLLQLFSEFVSVRMAESPSQQISGLDREFSALIQVHNTYFSGMKSGARTIGDKLARQIEILCQKDKGWIDMPQEAPVTLPLEKSADLVDFLQLAEKAYLAAPGSRVSFISMLLDALKRQDQNIS